MSAHTPGPWQTVESLDEAGHFSVHGTDGVPVCRLGGNHTNINAAANAALIAAAPDMLVILQSLVNTLGGGGGIPAYRGQVERARAAIVKATGGAA